MKTKVTSTETRLGIRIGGVVAAVLSYAKWHSIGYMILHALCGWVYVMYYIIYYVPRP
jgi:hypothetical protein